MRTLLVEEDRWKSRVLQEAARSLNFVEALALAYRAPEILEFLEALRRSLGRLEDEKP